MGLDTRTGGARFRFYRSRNDEFSNTLSRLLSVMYADAQEGHMRLKVITRTISILVSILAALGSPVSLAQPDDSSFVPVTDAMLNDPGPEACVITAHDAETGEELWRTYTIPRPGEPGYETWGDIPYEEPDQTQLYTLDWEFELTPGTENLGIVQAIAADTGETRWIYEQRAGTMSLVATGGGLVFGGDANGRFRAFDQSSGEVLWEGNIGSQVTGCPATYAVNGKQYVAVSTGTSNLTRNLMGLTPELNPGAANNLFVFALPD